ncbi:hypothetical protein V1511DRAFT_485708 [Dipodascopsis uninucleata]
MSLKKSSRCGQIKLSYRNNLESLKLWNSHLALIGYENGEWDSALGLEEFAKEYGTRTGSVGIWLYIIAPFSMRILERKKNFLVMAVLLAISVILDLTALTSYWQLAVDRIIVYSGIRRETIMFPILK